MVGALGCSQMVVGFYSDSSGSSWMESHRLVSVWGARQELRTCSASVYFLDLALKIDKDTAFDFRSISSRNTHSPLVLAMVC